MKLVHDIQEIEETTRDCEHIAVSVRHVARTRNIAATVPLRSILRWVSVTTNIPVHPCVCCFRTDDLNDAT